MISELASPPIPRPLAISHPAFDLHGREDPAVPVLVSVPHAGRAYDPALLNSARMGLAVLRRLEDRWVDWVALGAVAPDGDLLIARAPRALIDLNRHEREIDPAMIVDLPRSATLQSSAKLRGGLGLFPRRLPGAAELWTRPMPWAEAERRIEAVHRPYHAAIADRMRRARNLHGQSVLIDLHSMPPLIDPLARGAQPALVFGDRFGRSAASRLVALAAEVARAHSLPVANNHPYAGDHLIERHGRPDRGMHAIQIEIDRSLYLDAALDLPGPGLRRMQRVLADIVAALEEDVRRSSYSLAAE